MLLSSIAVAPSVISNYYNSSGVPVVAHNETKVIPNYQPNPAFAVDTLHDFTVGEDGYFYVQTPGLYSITSVVSLGPLSPITTTSRIDGIIEIKVSRPFDDMGFFNIVAIDTFSMQVSVSPSPGAVNGFWKTLTAVIYLPAGSVFRTDISNRIADNTRSFEINGAASFVMTSFIGAL